MTSGRHEGIRYAILPCSLGKVLVAATARGVCHVRLGDDDPELEKGLAEELPFAVLEGGDARVEAWCREVARCVDGESESLRVPLEVGASRFQRRVFDALCSIPRGRTRSYSEVARALGMPRGARAVARACATNPVAVVVPCHRVVAQDGGLGGYRYGTWRKRALLEREGAGGRKPCATPLGVGDDARVVDELLDELLTLLDLEDIELDIFRGRNESTRQGRLFGGQVAAQALVAAGRTTDGMPAHSLHGYFLRPGDPSVPVLYSVDRIRDGRSFTTRRVVALQRGKAIFNTSISFHEPEPSYEHQIAMPVAPDPETVPTWAERVQEMIDRIPEEARNWAPRPRPIDLRHVELPTYLGGEPRHGTSLVWMRASRKLDGDPLLHQALLAYASDFSLLDNIVRPHGRKGELGPLMMASLDHAVWFHRPLRMDEWLLYVQDSPVATGARGFARGTIFTRGGLLVASVAQEGLMRPARQPEDRSQ